MKISGDTALKNAIKTKPMNRYPNRKDPLRSRDGLLFPSIQPTFSLEPGAKIFTVGSCFARNIEEELDEWFDLPTLKFSVPKSEWPNRANSLINEFNPASMSQRLLWAADGIDTSRMTETFFGSNDKYIDLLLAGFSATPVTLDRGIERRQEIDKIYSELQLSSLLVITLGFVECWYDQELKTYLNRSPNPLEIRTNPKRYLFERLDITKTFELLEAGISATLDSGVKKILLTVSPVPLHATFAGDDCIVANSYSKSVLRAVAEMLRVRFQGNLDYFPSYEIALSGGLSAFIDDQIHVKPEVVKKIVQYLRDAYVDGGAV